MTSIAAGLLGHEVLAVERIGGGRNSQVYKIYCGTSGPFAAKFYFHGGVRGGDRLQAEFFGLQFLWQKGVRRIPRPIVSDRRQGCAIYEYVGGVRIPSREITASDVGQAVDFLVRLKEIRNRADSHLLPAASEACFSVQSVVHNIEQRLDRLFDLREEAAQYVALREFLSNEFVPLFEEVVGWCRLRLGARGVACDSELEAEKRTLSPSDFGFHNALRRPDGQIIFLDFEHFGWDDPAKMTADFLLHPAVSLREALKRRFLKGVLSGFRDQSDLAERVEIVYPLFGLKWCTILLNEFVPEHLRRRVFASRGDLDRSELQHEQLAKARQMLRSVRDRYRDFPYRD